MTGSQSFLDALFSITQIRAGRPQRVRVKRLLPRGLMLLENGLRVVAVPGAKVGSEVVVVPAVRGNPTILKGGE